MGEVQLRCDRCGKFCGDAFEWDRESGASRGEYEPSDDVAVCHRCRPRPKGVHNVPPPYDDRPNRPTGG